MEIEAKFRVDNVHALNTLLLLDHLGPYTLQPHAQSKLQYNTYYDTHDNRLQAAYYGLRIRNVDGQSIVTLKGPNQAQDGLHQRPEWEIEASEPVPSSWPASDLRDQVIALIGNAPLVPIVAIETTRHLIAIYRDNGEVAELCLDSGVFRAGERVQDFCELEIELLVAGQMDDLHALVEALHSHIHLIPENRSKLEQALALLEDYL